jgi:hypothetical protein
MVNLIGKRSKDGVLPTGEASSAPVTQRDAEAQCLLPEGSDCPLHCLGNLGHGRFAFRVRLEIAHVPFSPGFADSASGAFSHLLVSPDQLMYFSNINRKEAASPCTKKNEHALPCILESMPSEKPPET